MKIIGPRLRRIRRIDSQRISLTPLQRYTFFIPRKFFEKYFSRCCAFRLQEPVDNCVSQLLFLQLRGRSCLRVSGHQSPVYCKGRMWRAY
jgi:hypothetical protein